MNEELSVRSQRYCHDPQSAWWDILNDKLEKNRLSVQKNVEDKSVPLNYYAALDLVSAS